MEINVKLGRTRVSMSYLFLSTDASGHARSNTINMMKLLNGADAMCTAAEVKTEVKFEIVL